MPYLYIVKINRGPRDAAHPCTTIPNEIVWNNKMSAEARMTIIYMLSLGENRNVDVEQMRHNLGFGIDKMKAILSELTSFGYLSRSRVRGKNGRYTDIVAKLVEYPETIQRAVPANHNEK